jgi:hypothetical protein
MARASPGRRGSTRRRRTSCCTRSGSARGNCSAPCRAPKCAVARRSTAKPGSGRTAAPPSASGAAARGAVHGPAPHVGARPRDIGDASADSRTSPSDSRDGPTDGRPSRVERGSLPADSPTTSGRLGDARRDSPASWGARAGEAGASASSRRGMRDGLALVSTSRGRPLAAPAAVRPAPAHGGREPPAEFSPRRRATLAARPGCGP